MLGQSFMKIGMVVSLMLGITYFYFINQHTAPSTGQGWEVAANFGKIKLVYAEPEVYQDQLRLAGILDTLIGKQFQQYRGMFEIYFFDDLEHTPTDYALINRFNTGEEHPFTKDQFLHFRAQYTYCMPDESEFSYILLADTTVFPPKIQRIPSPIHPGIVGEWYLGWTPEI